MYVGELIMAIQVCWMVVLGICYLNFSNAQVELPTLSLLTLVPLPEPEGISPRPLYHGGEELISAAQLAVEKINMRNDILPGYRLELVPANTETCNQSLVTEAPVNFVRHVTSGDLNIVGVVGLVCSTVTQAISPLAGRPGIDLLQISAGATSPVFSSKEEYPRLYRMISSSAVYNDAVLALMATFQWRRIGVVQDTILIQHTTAANDFVAKVEQRVQFELVFLGDVSAKFPTSPIQSLLRKRARIVYASVTASEACELLCESYKLQTGLRHWLGFVWIFHDLSLEDLMNGTEKCTNEEILRSLDGAFLLQYRFDPNPNTTLVSGQTYSEYLMELQHRLGRTLQNQHANSMHDSVWAFALAVNSSLSENDLENGSVSTLVERNLRSVNFSGALGRIAFNGDREVVTEVDIFHVRGNEYIHAGHYNPLTGNLAVHLPPGSIPMDDFENVVLPLSRALPIVTLVITAALLVFNTVVLVLFIYYWNKPSIKATSPYLSVLILAGCYMLYIGDLISGSRELLHHDLFGPMCQAEIWFTATGMQLIYSTLFMRLLRIYRLFFFIFERHGKFWSDQVMIAASFVPVSITILLLILWSVLDPVATGYAVPLSEQSNVFERVTTICGDYSYAVWSSVIIFGVNGSMIVAVAFLAILTRKVHLECFRDSKQVNLFVFSTVVCLGTWFPYALTFVILISIPEAAYVFSVFPYLLIPFLCKVFLFVPKMWSSSRERRTIRRRKSSRSMKSSQFRAVQRSRHVRVISYSPSPLLTSRTGRLNITAIN